MKTTAIALPADLKRYPHHAKDLLQAWDSADELILQDLSAMGDLTARKILILNDSFGALSGALEGLAVTTYTDSYLSFKGIQQNSGGRITAISRLEELTGEYDLVLIRIPKNMSFFEDLLCRISAHLKAGAKVICGYMVKHQADKSFELLNQYIGETTTSLAKKKARLIYAEFKRPPAPSPYPLKITFDGFALPFVNHSNLFSREKLDIGTRFLLEHLPHGDDYKTILDLGCANGIVGIAAKQMNPRAKIIFTDESRMAVESAETNYRAYFPQDPRAPEAGAAEFHWTHCGEGLAPGSVDLVLCNPPFHQGNTIGDFIAWQMFKDSHRALAPGGLLRVIGNSHLLHQATLRKIFRATQLVAKNSKFTIVDAFR